MSEVTVKEIGSEFRTARTADHVCACGKAIRRGVRYERRVSLVDGDVVVSKTAEHIHSFEEEEWAFNRKHNFF